MVDNRRYNDISCQSITIFCFCYTVYRRKDGQGCPTQLQPNIRTNPMFVQSATFGQTTLSDKVFSGQEWGFFVFSFFWEPCSFALVRVRDFLRPRNRPKTLMPRMAPKPKKRKLIIKTFTPVNGGSKPVRLVLPSRLVKSRARKRCRHTGP